MQLPLLMISMFQIVVKNPEKLIYYFSNPNLCSGDITEKKKGWSVLY